ncbi:MAG TPA: hypothetical protein VFX70_23135 [Mycobacteriales bacterium]|nr:hypothetical protein [Mycobacteriales bacterium]
MRREALRVALYALPPRAARELRALIQPLDERYLAHSIPDPGTAHIRDMLTITPTRARIRPRQQHTFTFAVDLVYVGWLHVVVGDGRAEQRLYASFLTHALDDLLAALVALTRAEQHARMSWNGEPAEYRWLFTVDPAAYAHLHILRFPDESARLPDSNGHPIFDTDLPLRALVRSVAAQARALLDRLGEGGYARKWDAGPFPLRDLLTLERWLDDDEPDTRPNDPSGLVVVGAARKVLPPGRCRLRAARPRREQQPRR